MLVSSLILSQFAGLAPAQSTPGLPAQMLDSHEFMVNAIKHPAAPDHHADIERLLAQMTLQEKIGQMTQFDIAMITDGQNQTIKINPAKLQKAVVQYGVGSILNVYDEALTPERWQEIINSIQTAA